MVDGIPAVQWVMLGGASVKGPAPSGRNTKVDQKKGTAPLSYPIPWPRCFKTQWLMVSQRYNGRCWVGVPQVRSLPPTADIQWLALKKVQYLHRNQSHGLDIVKHKG